MATKMTLIISGSENGVSKVLMLENNFDSVMEKLVPTSPAGSALQARENMTYTDTEGNRVWVPNVHVGCVEENAEYD